MLGEEKKEALTQPSPGVPGEGREGVQAIGKCFKSDGGNWGHGVVGRSLATPLRVLGRCRVGSRAGNCDPKNDFLVSFCRADDILEYCGDVIEIHPL